MAKNPLNSRCFMDRPAYGEKAQKGMPSGEFFSFALNSTIRRGKTELLASSVVYVSAWPGLFLTMNRRRKEIIIFMKKLCHLQSVYLVLILLFEFYYG